MPGEHVDLRATVESDLETLRKAGNDPRVWKTLRDFEPSTVADEREFVERTRRAEDRVLFTVSRNGRPVGRVDLRGLGDRTGEATTSFFVVPEQTGKGYGTEAIALVLRYGFDHLRLHRVNSHTIEYNRAGERVLEKNGFTREGTKRDGAFINGEYWDVSTWGILEGEYREYRESEDEDAADVDGESDGDEGA